MSSTCSKHKQLVRKQTLRLWKCLWQYDRKHFEQSNACQNANTPFFRNDNYYIIMGIEILNNYFNLRFTQPIVPHVKFTWNELHVNFTLSFTWNTREFHVNFALSEFHVNLFTLISRECVSREFNVKISHIFH